LVSPTAPKKTCVSRLTGKIAARMSRPLTPGFEKPAFVCPLCSVYAVVKWAEVMVPSSDGGMETMAGYHTARCTHCNQLTFWRRGLMVHPSSKEIAPPPHEDTPADIASGYEEARSIAAQSPRSAAALLRLSIQKLCAFLGEDARDLNGAINSLVEKGLPLEIQQVLTAVRVAGNNAVSPGEIALDDRPEVADQLFELVNHIVDDRIGRPKRMKSLFDKLRDRMAAITKRDSVQSK
jgi:hypothetical protein